MPEETDVRRSGSADTPVEFLWNGLPHRVDEVLSHYRVRTPPAVSSSRPPVPDLSVPDPLIPDPPAPDPPTSAPTVAGPAGAPPADPPARAVRWHDQEVWRVRASRLHPPSPPKPVPGVFDLRFDWIFGRWTVIRIDTLEESP